MTKKYINPHLYKILQMIIEDYNLPIKRISADRIDIERRIMRYDTPHAILRYVQKNINKTIYMEYDEYRNIARDVMVYDNL